MGSKENLDNMIDGQMLGIPCYTQVSYFYYVTCECVQIFSLATSASTGDNSRVEAGEIVSKKTGPAINGGR